MNRDIVWTTRFKKNYKLALRRNLNIELLDNIIRALSRGEPLPEKTKTMNLQATGLDTGNVTSSQTGFSFTESKMMYWY